MSRTELLLSCFALLSIVGCGIDSPEVSSTAVTGNTEVSAESFQQTIETGGLVLAKFGAPWCGSCVELDPIMDQLEEANQGRLAVIRINVDNEPDLTAEYDISGIPRSFLFQDGKIIDEWLGWKESSVFQAAIDVALASSAPVGKVQVNEFTTAE